MFKRNLFVIILSTLFCTTSVTSSIVFGAGVESIKQQHLLRPPDSQNNTIPPVKNFIYEQGQNTTSDFYYWQGRPILLNRSSDEIVVRFDNNTDQQKRRDIVKNLAFSGEIIRNTDFEGYGLSIVKLQNVKQKDEIDDSLSSLRFMPDVEFAFPVFLNQKTGTKMFLTDEVTLRLKPGTQIEDILSNQPSLDLVVVQQIWGADDEYVLKLQDPKMISPLEAANAIFESGLVEWAEPNFVQDYKLNFTPNDPLFPAQWHLNNTGQQGQPPGADVRATDAWDIQRGSSSITIAVLDSGVDINHQDLAARIFVNTGETVNGVDDDGNGLVDDIKGWDFFQGDNNPNPDFTTNPNLGPFDSHGTNAAGVAGAIGNNGTGVSGICQNCKILPVRIGSPTSFAPSAAIGNAIRYAASFSDILSNSWGGGAPSSAIQSAIQYATTSGRGGLGSVVLFASGNSASGYGLAGGAVPAGTHRFIWTYSKDQSFSAGEDTAWLAWVLFPGGGLVNFEGGSLPSGWTAGGNQPWSVINDPTHADEGMCYRRAAKAGAIANSQQSFLQTIRTVPAGNIFSYVWVSSESGFDGLRLSIDLNNNGSIDLQTGLISGVPFVNTQVGYPAALPEAIAVGASSNRDCRSYYSQYGAQLDFVAPSNGGPLNLGITTTDLTGTTGADPTSYTNSFGGTSSACPLAAGVAGLILSEDNSLTQAAVRQLMRNTADKVGLAPYSGGRNNRYGFGRINAFAALQAITSPPSTDADYIGVKRGRTWYLDYNGSGSWNSGDKAYTFGLASDQPIAGDWNGNGSTAIGVKRGKKWYLDYNGSGSWNSGDKVYTFGLASDQPIAGDWNGNGKAAIGVKRGNKWYLDYNGNGTWDSGDKVYTFGLASDKPMAGNW